MMHVHGGVHARGEEPPLVPRRVYAEVAQQQPELGSKLTLERRQGVRRLQRGTVERGRGWWLGQIEDVQRFRRTVVADAGQERGVLRRFVKVASTTNGDGVGGIF